MQNTFRIASSLVGFAILFWNLAACKDAILLLTNDNGSYWLHFYENDTWFSRKVSNAYLKDIEDVDFNYMNRTFFFTNSRPDNNKGVWRASFPDTLNATSLYDVGFLPSHKFSRVLSKPKQLQLYPESDSVFVYDAGYDNVVAMSISEVQSMNARSYFQEVESIRMPFYFDPERRQLIAFGKTSASVYQSQLYNSIVPATFLVNLTANNFSSVLAFDASEQTVFFCLNGSLAATSFNGTSNTSSPNLPCSPSVVTSGSTLLYLNKTSAKLEKFSYTLNSSGFNLQPFDDPFSLPNSFSANSQVVSFKTYSYPENATEPFCKPKQCDHICIPDEAGNASCICSDFFSKNSTGQCAADLITGQGFVLLEPTLRNNETGLMWLMGDPSEWTRRPRRERAMKINSHVIAITSDYDNNRTFAVEHRMRQIFWFKNDGSTVSMTDVSQISAGIKSIAFDWVGKNIIWFDPAYQWLRIAPLKDNRSKRGQVAYKTVVVQPNLEGYSLALDASDGYIFFLDYEDVTSTVFVVRCLMDGSNATNLTTSFNSSYFDQDLFITNSLELLPGALTVDAFAKKIYVAFANYIFVMNYNGDVEYHSEMTFPGFTMATSRVASIEILNSSFAGIVLHNVTSPTQLLIYKINRDLEKNTIQNLTYLGLREVNNEFRFLTAFQPHPPSNVDCDSLNCSDICLNFNGTPTCHCPDGYDFRASRCVLNMTQPSVPLIVYTRGNRACYRPISAFINSPSFVIIEGDDQAQKCTALSDSTNMTSALAPDHLGNSVVFINGNTIRRWRLRRSLIPVRWITERTSVIATLSADAQVLTMAYDDFAQNLYFADRNARTLAVAAVSETSYPVVLVTNALIEALAIDVVRRGVYYAQFSEQTSQTEIKRLYGNSNNCTIARFTGLVTQMEVSFANSSLVMLVNLTKIATLKLNASDYAPFSNCQMQDPVYTTIDSTVGNVTGLGLYGSTLVLVNEIGLMFSSINLGVNVTSTSFNVNGNNGDVWTKGVSVLNPWLRNGTNYKMIPDKCAESGGDCEQLCLANSCQCFPGQELLADGVRCRPKDFSKDNDFILVADDKRHKIFGIPLPTTSLDNFPRDFDFTSFKIHLKAQPQALAYHQGEGRIYYADGERGSILSFDPVNQSHAVTSQLVWEQSSKLRRGQGVRGLVYLPSKNEMLASFYTPGSPSTLVRLAKNEVTLPLKSDSMAFYGMAVDSSTAPGKDQVFVGVLNAGNITIMQYDVDGQGEQLFSVTSYSATGSELYIELAIAADKGRLFVSYPGAIVTKTWPLKNPDPMEIFLNSTKYRGIAVRDGFLLASDYISGGIDVYIIDTKEFKNTIGSSVFHGLGAMHLFAKQETRSASVSSTSSPSSETSTGNAATSTIVPTTTTGVIDALKTAATENYGASIGTAIGIIILVVAVIAVVVYCKKRRSSISFHRLEIPSTNRYFRMADDDDDAFESDIAPGSVSFRNPVYGMDEIDIANGQMPAANRNSRSNNQNGLDIFAEAEGGL